MNAIYILNFFFFIIQFSTAAGSTLFQVDFVGSANLLQGDTLVLNLADFFIGDNIKYKVITNSTNSIFVSQKLQQMPHLTYQANKSIIASRASRNLFGELDGNIFILYSNKTLWWYNSTSHFIKKYNMITLFNYTCYDVQPVLDNLYVYVYCFHLIKLSTPTFGSGIGGVDIYKFNESCGLYDYTVYEDLPNFVTEDFNPEAELKIYYPSVYQDFFSEHLYFFPHYYPNSSINGSITVYSINDPLNPEYVTSIDATWFDEKIIFENSYTFQIVGLDILLDEIFIQTYDILIQLEVNENWDMTSVHYFDISSTYGTLVDFMVINQDLTLVSLNPVYEEINFSKITAINLDKANNKSITLDGGYNIKNESSLLQPKVANSIYLSYPIKSDNSNELKAMGVITSANIAVVYFGTHNIQITDVLYIYPYSEYNEAQESFELSQYGNFFIDWTTDNAIIILDKETQLLEYANKPYLQYTYSNYDPFEINFEVIAESTFNENSYYEFFYFEINNIPYESTYFCPLINEYCTDTIDIFEAYAKEGDIIVQDLKMDLFLWNELEFFSEDLQDFSVSHIEEGEEMISSDTNLKMSDILYAYGLSNIYWKSINADYISAYYTKNQFFELYFCFNEKSSLNCQFEWEEKYENSPKDVVISEYVTLLSWNLQTFDIFETIIGTRVGNILQDVTDCESHPNIYEGSVACITNEENILLYNAEDLLIEYEEDYPKPYAKVIGKDLNLNNGFSPITTQQSPHDFYLFVQEINRTTIIDLSLISYGVNPTMISAFYPSQSLSTVPYFTFCVTEDKIIIFEKSANSIPFISIYDITNIANPISLFQMRLAGDASFVEPFNVAATYNFFYIGVIYNSNYAIFKYKIDSLSSISSYVGYFFALLPSAYQNYTFLAIPLPHQDLILINKPTVSVPGVLSQIYISFNYYKVQWTNNIIPDLDTTNQIIVQLFNQYNSFNYSFNLKITLNLPYVDSISEYLPLCPNSSLNLLNLTEIQGNFLNYSIVPSTISELNTRIWINNSVSLLTKSTISAFGNSIKLFQILYNSYRNTYFALLSTTTYLVEIDINNNTILSMTDLSSSVIEKNYNLICSQFQQISLFAENDNLVIYCSSNVVQNYFIKVSMETYTPKIIQIFEAPYNIIQVVFTEKYIVYYVQDLYFLISSFFSSVQYIYPLSSIGFSPANFWLIDLDAVVCCNNETIVIGILQRKSLTMIAAPPPSSSKYTKSTVVYVYFSKYSNISSNAAPSSVQCILVDAFDVQCTVFFINANSNHIIFRFSINNGTIRNSQQNVLYFFENIKYKQSNIATGKWASAMIGYDNFYNVYLLIYSQSMNYSYIIGGVNFLKVNSNMLDDFSLSIVDLSNGSSIVIIGYMQSISTYIINSFPAIYIGEKKIHSTSLTIEGYTSDNITKYTFTLTNSKNWLKWLLIGFGCVLMSIICFSFLYLYCFYKIRRKMMQKIIMLPENFSLANTLNNPEDDLNLKLTGIQLLDDQQNEKKKS